MTSIPNNSDFQVSSNNADSQSSPVKFNVPSSLLKSSNERLSKVRALQSTRAATPISDISSSSSGKNVADLKTVATNSDGGQNNSVTITPKPALQPSLGQVATSNNKFNLAEINRIKNARELRRQKTEAIREARSGMDSVEVANSEYLSQIETFRSVWRIWVDKWKSETSSLTTKQSEWNGNTPIQVCVRKRPLSSHEKSGRAFDVVTMCTSSFPNASIFVHETKTGLDQSYTITTQHFAFDKIFDELAGNDYIYRNTLFEAIPCLLEGENVSLFAYGATSSGKTHTIFGPNGGKTFGSCSEDTGLYQYACLQLFQLLQDYPEIKTFVSFLEIYSGRVYDLLNGRQQVKLLENDNNFYFQGLQEYSVTNFNETQNLMERGMSTRSTEATEVNHTSSRSHAVFRVELRFDKKALDNGKKPTSMLSLIDLAGSERGVDTPNSSVDRRREGAAINQSLLALKECIRALHIKSSYVPFRSSKLTCVLRECFGQPLMSGPGSRCFMLLNISPTNRSIEQTLSGLWYTNRVKEYSHGGAVVGRNGISAQELIEQLLAVSPSSNEGAENDQSQSFGQPEDRMQQGLNDDELDSSLLSLSQLGDSDKEVKQHELYVDEPSDTSTSTRTYPNAEIPKTLRSRVLTFSEEDLLRVHHQTLRSLTKLLDEGEVLLEQRTNKDIRPNDYVQALTILIDEKISKLLELKSLVLLQGSGY